jgi:hypothetical protein
MLGVSDASKPTTPVVSQPERYVLSPEQSRHDHPQQNITAHQDLGTTLAVVNEAVQNLGVPPEVPGQLESDRISGSINAPQELPPEQLPMNDPDSTSLMDVFSTETALDFIGSGTDTFFNLGLLDWDILDNSFVAPGEDIGTLATCSESSNLQVISPEATISPHDVGDGRSQSVAPIVLPLGMSLMQIYHWRPIVRKSCSTSGSPVKVRGDGISGSA